MNVLFVKFSSPVEFNVPPCHSECHTSKTELTVMSLFDLDASRSIESFGRRGAMCCGRVKVWFQFQVLNFRPDNDDVAQAPSSKQTLLLLTTLHVNIP